MACFEACSADGQGCWEDWTADLQAVSIPVLQVVVAAERLSLKIGNIVAPASETELVPGCVAYSGDSSCP